MAELLEKIQENPEPLTDKPAEIVTPPAEPKNYEELYKNSLNIISGLEEKTRTLSTKMQKYHEDIETVKLQKREAQEAALQSAEAKGDYEAAKQIIEQLKAETLQTKTQYEQLQSQMKADKIAYLAKTELSKRINKDVPPDDALVFLTDLELTEDGQAVVDLEAKIAALIEKRPYLTPRAISGERGNGPTSSGSGGVTIHSADVERIAKALDQPASVVASSMKNEDFLKALDRKGILRPPPELTFK